ncbi:MAG: UDP-N-acetylmuramoyl-L-alanyl-D-glutamate--2,6-diaminopimelate ligase [Oscillospiraceae bacterium]|jgi:UDP-N-acetylmuramoyl-L-alanyl-D-glutamate--2,6-diaminopimelate ligase|nr:UDP-N-acetylmuramoyl-L-alanyl-D-glutamate--2,6-diaminopimelate ligase [Oscillospiraceae bacterium]
MRLAEIMKGIDCRLGFDCEVSDVTNDSREVKAGSVFVCIQGVRMDGHDFAASALEKGAAAVVCERDLGLAKQALVADSHKAFGKMAANFYGNPAERLRLVGVTGTKGKTTVTTLVKAILTRSGQKVGLIGTNQHETGGEIVPSSNSTPGPMTLQGLYAAMRGNGYGFCVMEVSSHALDQQRIGDSFYETAVFTNLAHEHLDYHKDMEDYFAAKAKLFSICSSAVVNLDDEYGRRLLGMIKVPVMTFSLEREADLMAKEIVCHADSVDFVLCAGGVESRVHFAMPGRFSVKNALAAAGACLQLGVGIDTIVSALSEVKGICGRIEIIPTHRDFTVITDYAHTPDSLENVLSSLKETVSGRLVALFGCGGDRDRSKRPLMAAAAARYADRLIVTSDNPRTEDPQAIIDEILPGLEGTEVPYDVVVNRREAIYFALRQAKPGDTIVLAGKGNEDYQIIGHEKFPFDERIIVAEALKEIYG